MEDTDRAQFLKERKREYNRRFIEKHGKKYYEKNKEKILKQQKEYRKTHPRVKKTGNAIIDYIIS